MLKLFYCKSINYRYFVDEKDEIINLITYIIFNIKNIYINIAKILFFMNFNKIEKLEIQFQKFGDLSPEEVGISPKFCLDKQTDELMEKFKKEKNDIKDKDNENNNNVAQDDKENKNESEKETDTILNIEKSKKNNVIKSNKINNLVEYFEKNSKTKNLIKGNQEYNKENNNKQKNENKNEEFNNISIKKLNSLIFFENRLNLLNITEEDISEQNISKCEIQDFKKSFELYETKKNFQELLLDNIDTENFHNLQKLPYIDDNMKMIILMRKQLFIYNR